MVMHKLTLVPLLQLLLVEMRRLLQIHQLLLGQLALTKTVLHRQHILFHTYACHVRDFAHLAMQDASRSLADTACSALERVLIYGWGRREADRARGA